VARTKGKGGMTVPCGGATCGSARFMGDAIGCLRRLLFGDGEAGIGSGGTEDGGAGGGEVGGGACGGKDGGECGGEDGSIEGEEDIIEGECEDG
jgi:hypothetical protein